MLKTRMNAFVGWVKAGERTKWQEVIRFQGSKCLAKMRSLLQNGIVTADDGLILMTLFTICSMIPLEKHHGSE